MGEFQWEWLKIKNSVTMCQSLANAETVLYLLCSQFEQETGFYKAVKQSQYCPFSHQMHEAEMCLTGRMWTAHNISLRWGRIMSIRQTSYQDPSMANPSVYNGYTNPVPLGEWVQAHDQRRHGKWSHFQQQLTQPWLHDRACSRGMCHIHSKHQWRNNSQVRATTA